MKLAKKAAGGPFPTVTEANFHLVYEALALGPTRAGAAGPGRLASLQPSPIAPGGGPSGGDSVSRGTSAPLTRIGAPGPGSGGAFAGGPGGTPSLPPGGNTGGTYRTDGIPGRTISLTPILGGDGPDGDGDTDGAPPSDADPIIDGGMTIDAGLIFSRMDVLDLVPASHPMQASIEDGSALATLSDAPTTIGLDPLWV